MIMAKKGMTHPDVTRGPRNDLSPVPQIQGKAKSGKEKANPIIAGTTGANQKGVARKAHIQGSWDH